MTYGGTREADRLRAVHETACGWENCGRWQTMGLRRTDQGKWELVCQKHYDDEPVEFRRATLQEYAESLP